MEAALRAVSRFGDSVIKPVFGYKGKDIARVRNGEVLFSDRKVKSASLEASLDRLLEERGMLYIQEFIENPGRDIRAFVVGGTAIGAIYRKAAAGSWVNNLSQGGSADRCVLTNEQKELAEKASLAIGTTFAGVDHYRRYMGRKLMKKMAKTATRRKAHLKSLKSMEHLQEKGFTMHGG